MTLVLITLACAILSVVVRRATFTLRWEVPSTLAVVLLGMGVVLTSIPDGLIRIGGHICLLLAAAAIGVTAACRIDGTTCSTIARWIATPFSFTAAAMLLSAFAGQWWDPERWYTWLTIYLLAFNTGLTYLLGYAVLALLVLTGDERQRFMANLYIIPCSAGILAHAGQWVIGWLAPIESHEWWDSVILFCITVWVGGFALATAYSWRRKTVGFRKLQKALR